MGVKWLVDSTPSEGKMKVITYLHRSISEILLQCIKDEDSKNPKLHSKDISSHIDDIFI